MKIKSSPGVAYPRVRFEDCPAKTWPGPGTGGFRDEVHLGRSVEDHCAIVCHVAQELISRLPPSIQQLFPKDAAFAAGCHDIGKVSPYFYEKLRRACSHGVDHLVRVDGIDPSLESQWGGHAGISQLCALHMGAPKFVPEILGNHHGRSPSVNGRSAIGEPAGGVDWQEERRRLVETLSAKCGMGWPTIQGNNQARLVSGLATVSDWIGSGRLFENPGEPWRDKIAQAVDEAGFVPPSYRNGLSFEQVFGFSPRRAQEDLVNTIKGPGVYIFEAPMGLGKTEAALYAAYRMLESGQASGIYFALPTQLTSNRIWARFEPFLDAILDGKIKHRSWLVHSSSWMLEAEQGEDARPGGAWFNQAKRGLLAPFAVGTIDQALLGVMRVAHGFVRAFGLAGKVVILDEVHTYDAYTGTLLDQLVVMLRELGCTVIILSATLDASRRRSLLPESGDCDAYPLITAQPSAPDAKAVQVAIPSDVVEGRRVHVRMDASEEAAMDEALARAQCGQQVLWIENTVQGAQDRFRALAARASGIECGLLHARFIPNDRATIENRWVHLFGKSGWGQRGEQGRILVGTQSLAQSLDLDADYMVSAFAPTDMLLQRLGRLWRHGGTPRPDGATHPQAWLIAPDVDLAIQDPGTHFGVSSFVYSSYVLCRSLMAWQGRKTVDLPGDIRPLINATYSPLVDPRLDPWWHEMEKGRRGRPGRETLRSNAAAALSEYGNTSRDDDHATRFGDRPMVQWLLVSSIDHGPDGSTHLSFLDGTSVRLPRARSALSKSQWRQCAVDVAKNIVSTPDRPGAPKATVEKVRQLGLHHVCYLGGEGADQVSQVQVAIVGLDGIAFPIHGASSVEPSPRYDRVLGYQAPSRKVQR